MVDALGFAPDAAIGCRDFKIGCIGAGFIMADVHLAASHPEELLVGMMMGRGVRAEDQNHFQAFSS